MHSKVSYRLSMRNSLGPKPIANIVDTGKLVVASLKLNGEEVYKRTWDSEYIDLPVVDPRIKTPKRLHRKR
jgi:hypothetical protein